MIATIQLRRGTAAEWTAKNPVLASGEPGMETDTGKFKLGDGSSRWTALAYFRSGLSLPIAESDVTNLVSDLAAKEILANKSTSTALGTSDTLYPSQKAVKTYADTKVTSNAAITGATKTKITFDSKGLVTAGSDCLDSDLSISDITTNNVSTSKHGFTPKAPADTTKFLRGDASWATVSSSGGGGPWPAFTAPVNGDYAWVNQGGASVNATSFGIYLSAPGSGTGDNLRVRKKAAPSTPYTITAAIIPSLVATTNCMVGIGFRASGSGALIVVAVLLNTNVIQVIKYNSPTSWNATPTSLSYPVANTLTYLRIKDDGTNRIISYSSDGLNFHDISSEGRTVFLTADETLFFANSNSSAHETGVQLVSWKEE